MDLFSTIAAKNRALLNNISIFKWCQYRAYLKKEFLSTKRWWKSSNKWSLWDLMNQLITLYLMSITLSSTYSFSWILFRFWKTLLWRNNSKRKLVFTSSNTSDVCSHWIIKMANFRITSLWQKIGCLLYSDQPHPIKIYQSTLWAILDYFGLKLRNK